MWVNANLYRLSVEWNCGRIVSSRLTAFEDLKNATKKKIDVAVRNCSNVMCFNLFNYKEFYCNFVVLFQSANCFHIVLTFWNCLFDQICLTNVKT